MEMDKSPADSTTTLVPSDAANPANSLPGNSSIPMNVQNFVGNQKLFNNLPPQPVGREFVRQFYTMMGKYPKLLYRFYSANSTLTFGNNPIIMGQEKIRKDIEKRELHSCHARIHKIDAQPTLGNGVVVQVIGELSNNLQPLRPFTQTFVLSPHIPKNYYVHNEIFRYQDELYPDITLGSFKLELVKQNSATPQTTQATTMTSNGTNTDTWLPATDQPAIVKKQPTIVDIESHEIEDLSNNSSKQTENKSISTIETEIPETQLIGEPTNRTNKKPKQSAIKSTLDTDIQEPLTVITTMETAEPPSSSTSQTQLNSNNAGVLVEMNEEFKSELDDNNTRTSSNTLLATTTAIPALQNSPMTYANVFKSASGQFKIKPPTDVLPEILHSEISTTYIPSATFSPTNSPVLPATTDPTTRKQTPITTTTLGTTTPTPIPESKINKPTIGLNTYRYNRNDAANTRYIGKPNNNNLIGSTSYLPQRRNRPPRERYNDSHQLFLGNLPPSATVEALTPIFSRFGNILELRVLSKSVQPGMKKLPNYGFLTYDNKDSVQRCLDNAPFYFPENTRNGSRLNVRPKNTDESQVTRPIHSNNTRNELPTNELPKNPAGNFNSRMSYKRNEKRLRYETSSHESEVTTTIVESSQINHNSNNSNNNVVVSERRHESKAFTMDDWPLLSSPAGGGGGGNFGNLNQRKEQQKPTN